MLKKSNLLQTALLAFGLLVICFLSYAVALGKVGFFLDDWYIIWTYRTFGTAKFAEFFKGDRPLFSYVYRFFIPIFKDSAFGWQLFAIFTKWLSALSLWVLLRMLLPQRKWLTYAVAAIFLVYPGFKFHYFSVMKSQGYALFTIYILSHIFMVLAVRKPKRRIQFFAAAIICQIIGIAPQEYYYGFELVRPIVIYLSLPEEDQGFKSSLSRAFKFWLPNLAVMAGFTFFRISQSNLYSYQISFLQQFRVNPLQSIITFGNNLASGLLSSCLQVWTELIEHLYQAEAAVELPTRLGLVVLVGLVFWYFLYRAEQKETGTTHWRQSAALVGLGLIVALAAMIPFLGGGFTVGLDWHNNRFLSPVSIGASLFLVALIELIIPKKKQLKLALLALIIGLSVQANYVNGIAFIDAWNQQADFFAQLTWRAPQIETGTVVITPDVPFGQYFSGPSLTAPLNLIYAPDLHENPVPYQLMLSGTPQMESMPDLIQGQRIDLNMRVSRFVGNTSDMIVVFQPRQGCLQVLSSTTPPKSFESDRYAAMWEELIALSNLDLINIKAPSAILPEEFFGKISTDNWCYHFQRAALAEQQEAWRSVVAEYNQAEQAGFSAKSTREWLPLIRALIHLGETNSALEVSSRILLEDEFARQGLCSAWQTYYQPESASGLDQVDSYLEGWHCEE